MNNNKITLQFKSLSKNESFVRGVISAYALTLNPSISEITDIKTAVSEAVTNAIVHAYKGTVGEVTLEAYTTDNTLHIKISDKGIGIENIDEALEPFFTTGLGDDERSGMGFTIIKSFMDDFKIESEPNKGTTVYMSKNIKSI
jgi:stage II sporulation protein AB (anti-sigma F factor)